MKADAVGAHPGGSLRESPPQGQTAGGGLPGAGVGRGVQWGPGFTLGRRKVLERMVVMVAQQNDCT